MKIPVGKVIEAVRIAKGLSQSDLARALKVTPQAVQKWESGGRPRHSRLMDIASALGVHVGVLLEFEDPFFRFSESLGIKTGGFEHTEEFDTNDLPEDEIETSFKPVFPVSLSDHPDLIDIPRVKFKLSAGVTGFAIEQDQGSGPPIFFRRDFFDDNGYRPDSLFAVRVTGSSMEPSLWEGDLVVINTKDATPTDGEPFALNYEGELVIKRLKRDAGEWWATSDNPDQRRFSPKRCNEDVKIIGKAVYKQSSRI